MRLKWTNCVISIKEFNECIQLSSKAWNMKLHATVTAKKIIFIHKYKKRTKLCKVLALTIPFHNRIIFSIFFLDSIYERNFFEICWHSFITRRRNSIVGTKIFRYFFFSLSLYVYTIYVPLFVNFFSPEIFFL